MAKKFDDVEIGDQLEMPAHRGAMVYGADHGLNPERTIRAAVITHIWYDPVDDKEYVGIAYIRRGGTYGRPSEKRTITGIARSGWRKATTDWLAKLKAENEAENVVNLWGRN